VKDYPQLSVRLPGEIKDKLTALSRISGRPQWRLITDAVDCYLAQCGDDERRMVDDLLTRRRASGRRPLARGNR
jgi:predicted DNA-binding protein